MSTELRKVEPGSRIDRLEFGGQSEHLNKEIHVGSYICPYCKSRLSFNTSDLERHFSEYASNLDRPTQKAFDAFRPLEPGRWQAFIDFYCDGCQRPVRIIYEPGGQYAMGCYAQRLVEIIEAV